MMAVQLVNKVLFLLMDIVKAAKMFTDLDAGCAMKTFARIALAMDAALFLRSWF